MVSLGFWLRFLLLDITQPNKSLWQKNPSISKALNMDRNIKKKNARIELPFPVPTGYFLWLKIGCQITPYKTYLPKLPLAPSTSNLQQKPTNFCLKQSHKSSWRRAKVLRHRSRAWKKWPTSWVASISTCFLLVDIMILMFHCFQPPILFD